MISEELKNAFGLLIGNTNDAEWLYQHWWSGEAHFANFPLTSTQFHDAFLARVALNLDRDLIVNDGVELFKVSSGDYLLNNDTEVLIQRRLSWEDSHWHWVQSRMPERLQDSQKLRIYVPSPLSEPVITGSLIADALLREDFNFLLKWRRSSGTFKDFLVIWISARDLVEVLDCVNTLEIEPACGPPPLTLKSKSIGIAEHPENGDSFGLRACEEIWRVVRVSTGFQSLGPKPEILGFDPQKPWRLTAVNDHSWEESIAKPKTNN